MRTALTLALLVGCGDEGSEARVCAARVGTYQIILTETSGTCGERPGQVVTIAPGDTSPIAPCTGFVDVTPDGCDVNYNLTCPEPNLGPTYTSENIGSVRWSYDGGTGQGVEELTVRWDNGTAVCKSTYSIRWDRQ
jgi:hypothetical protein